MSDTSTTTTDGSTTTDDDDKSTKGTGQAGGDDTGDKSGDDTTDYKAEARKWEQRAKANKDAAERLAQLEADGMSDVDKVRAEGRKEGETAANAKAAKRLVAAEMRGRLGQLPEARTRGIDVDELLDGVDSTRFVDDDGEPDSKRISQWIDKVVPKGTGVDTGGGRRTGGGGKNDMNDIIRKRMRGG